MKILYRGKTKGKNYRSVEIRKKERDDGGLFNYILKCLDAAGWTASNVERDGAAEAVEIIVKTEDDFKEIKAIYQDIKTQYL